MVKNEREWTAANRRNWDERAGLHLLNRTGFYGIDRVRAGEDILHAIEAGEIGDLTGKRLLHLQCHFGLDTICLARRGAAVTGLDFSEVAIAGARALAAELGVTAEFVKGEIYDARAVLTGKFDRVYVTWGTICWLPDMRRWAQVVASLLASGGSLYLADTHPSAQILEEIDGRIVPHYPWRTPTSQPLVFDDPETYTGDPTKLTHTRNYEWIHPLSEIVTAVIEAGLVVEFLHEHERLPWKLFPSMAPCAGGLFRLPDKAVPIPLAFSLLAIKS
ncbi:MAG TPA: class I SAM-dependent methyltransferase [Alphaproteobacteria bacterium]|nr:class I SAM-dependent methyltransferase [Alphaproteobacteria bacterium]